MPRMHQLLLVLVLVSVTGAEHGPRQAPDTLDVPKRFQEEFSNYVNADDESMVNDPNEPATVREWPPEQLPFGQVSGLAVDVDGNLHVFHRGQRVWDENSFDEGTNVFKQQADGPIKEETHVVLDGITGEVLFAGGESQFYMPHGLALDHEGNAWMTDVAMHQVFKYDHKTHKAVLILGEKFVPGSDEKHFCKPTDVAVSKSGEFFVADGYCNSRIMKFGADGKFLTQFGKATANTLQPAAPGTFRNPHSVALIDDWNLLCVADRENERIECFTAGLRQTAGGKSLPAGMLLKTASNLGRVFAIRAKNHYLYGVTNNLDGAENQVFKVDLRNGESVTEAPGLENAHCIAVADDETIYIGETGPDRILKIE